MSRPFPLMPPDGRSEAFYEDLVEPLTVPRATARLGARGLLAALALLMLLAVLTLPSAPAAAATAQDTAADLRMAESAAPMRRLAERFVARAQAGDAAGSAALLSRALLGRIGEAQAAQTLRQQILPFFDAGGRIGRSVTVTHTTDAAGQQGFAFYMWWVAEGREPRPFTVYVVDEAGGPAVANIVPDRLVAGRHR